MIPWQSLIALSMASAERIDESDIFIPVGGTAMVNYSHVARHSSKQSNLTRMEIKRCPGDNTDSDK